MSWSAGKNAASVSLRPVEEKAESLPLSVEMKL
jgi:hypothetical protein